MLFRENLAPSGKLIIIDHEPTWYEQSFGATYTPITWNPATVPGYHSISFSALLTQAKSSGFQYLSKYDWPWWTPNGYAAVFI